MAPVTLQSSQVLLNPAFIIVLTTRRPISLRQEVIDGLKALFEQVGGEVLSVSMRMDADLIPTLPDRIPPPESYSVYELMGRKWMFFRERKGDTDSYGHNFCIVLVVMKDEDGAQKALAALNGVVIDGSVVTTKRVDATEPTGLLDKIE